MGTFALFGVSLMSEQRRKLSNKWLGLFVLMAFARMFYGDYSHNPALEWYNFWLDSASFIYVLCGVLLLNLVYCYVDNIRIYLKPILCVCIMNFILSTSQVLGYDFMWSQTQSVNGFMDTCSQLGQYSAMACPLLYYINPFLIIIPITTVIISKSVSCALAASIGMITLLVLTQAKKAIVWGSVVAIILLAILFHGHISLKAQSRPKLWGNTLKVALRRPFVGYGYGSFHKEVIKTEKAIVGGFEQTRAHNDYLHTAQELGFPIVVVLALFFIGLFKKFKVAEKDKLLVCLGSSVLIVLVNMSGQTLIRYASLAGTFIVVLALFMIRLEGEGYVSHTSTNL